MFNLFDFAYLDPGTGSLIIQAIIGAIAGVSVFGRNAIHKVIGKFRKPSNQDDSKLSGDAKQPDQDSVKTT